MNLSRSLLCAIEPLHRLVDLIRLHEHATAEKTELGQGLVARERLCEFDRGRELLSALVEETRGEADVAVADVEIEQACRIALRRRGCQIDGALEMVKRGAWLLARASLCRADEVLQRSTTVTRLAVVRGQAIGDLIKPLCIERLKGGRDGTVQLATALEREPFAKHLPDKFVRDDELASDARKQALTF